MLTGCKTPIIYRVSDTPNFLMNEIRITVPVETKVHNALVDAAKKNDRAVSREAAAILKKQFVGRKPLKRRGAA